MRSSLPPTQILNQHSVHKQLFFLLNYKFLNPTPPATTKQSINNHKIPTKFLNPTPPNKETSKEKSITTHFLIFFLKKAKIRNKNTSRRRRERRGSVIFAIYNDNERKGYILEMWRLVKNRKHSWSQFTGCFQYVIIDSESLSVVLNNRS